MSAWLVENFFWVAAFLVAVIVGLKVIFGLALKRLMDASEADEKAQEKHRQVR